MNNKKTLSSFYLPQDYTYLYNWVELSTSALEHNVEQFQKWLGPDTKIIAVIKSNAYGHGLIEIAGLHDGIDAIAMLCTINLSEAVSIKKQGVHKPILVIGYLDMSYDYIIQYDIQVIVYDLTIAHQLDELAKKHHAIIQVHIKFDTGMSRLGITSDGLDEFIKKIQQLTSLIIVSICSHLAQGYDADATHAQETIFLQTMTYPYLTHLANSHGSLKTTSQQTYARIGSGLYGYLQKEDAAKQQKLLPVLSLKTKILQIKQVKAGTFIGYDGLYQALTDMTIATIAIGYHEGLDARLSNCGKVIINDQYAPIIGRICMNLTIIDITMISDAKVGQTLTIIGKETNCSLSFYDWSALTNASVYNLTTKLFTHIPKIIIP